MLTMKRVVGPLNFAAAALLFATAAGAATTSDQPASVVIYPKIVFSSGTTPQGPVLTDTVVEIANTSTSPVNLHCFYVNATSHCTNSGLSCVTSLDCAGIGSCIPGWAETDFDVTLTGNQPFYWKASTGRNRSCASATTCEPLPLQGFGFCTGPGGGHICTSDNDCGGTTCTFNGQSNAGTSVPPLPESDFFVGELKCVAVNGLGEPQNNNSVIGTATIVTELDGGVVDAESYNAVGIKANSRCMNLATMVCNTDADCPDDSGPCQAVDVSQSNVLTLGPDTDPNAGYQGCPDTLVVDHIFDGAPDPVSPGVDEIFVTDLTLVPCSEDFEIGAANLGRSTAQFLVFNEFEQRFSTSVPVTCFEESLLSNLDTRNNARSIFSVSVSGTIAGQSRIHPIGDGLLGVALVQKPAAPFPTTLADISTAVTSQGLPPVIGVGAGYDIHEQGDRTTEDQIILP